MKRTTYIASDKHKVKSRAELVIDNILTSNNIIHEYEKKITLNEINLSPDWYLPDCDAYIEFWGMESNKKYADHQRKKLKVYAESGMKFLSLDDAHLENIPFMEKKILGFIGDIQKQIEEKEKLDRIEEEKRQEEIERVRSDTEAEVKKQEKVARFEERVKQKKKESARAKAEAKQKKDETDEELVKLMATAITWTIEGVKTGFDNLFRSKRKKAPRDKNCIYCHNNLITSRHVCSICQAKALTKNLCVFCGKATKKAKICVTCRNNSHHNCRLCRREITQPQMGKPVCDHCVLKIPFKRKR